MPLLVFLLIVLDFVSRRLFLFLHCQSKQLPGIVETRCQLVDCYDDPLKRRAFLAQRLRTIRLIPHIGLLKFALNFS